MVNFTRDKEMNYSDDFEDRKNRKPKFKKQHIKKHLLDDDEIKRNNAKKEVKKMKENLDNEEWEDWDQYYNH